MQKTEAPYDWTEVTYPSAPVERMTGVPRLNQRQMLFRNFVSRTSDRPGQFSPRQIAELFLLNIFRTEVSVPLDLAADHAKKAASTLLWAVLVNHQPWRFDGSPREEQMFRSYMRARDEHLDGDCKQLIGKSRTWKERRFLIWRGGSWYEADDLPSFLEATRRRGMAVIHLDLYEDVAPTFFDKLEGPLYTVRSKAAAKGSRRQ